MATEQLIFPIVVRDKAALPFRVIPATGTDATGYGGPWLTVIAGGVRVGRITAGGTTEEIIERAVAVVRNAIGMEIAERDANREWRAMQREAR